MMDISSYLSPKKSSWDLKGGAAGNAASALEPHGQQNEMVRASPPRPVLRGHPQAPGSSDPGARVGCLRVSAQAWAPGSSAWIMK